MESGKKAAPKGIDAIQDANAIEHEVFNPADGEKLGTFLQLAGPEHEVRREHSDTIARSAKHRAKQERNPVKALTSQLIGGDPDEDRENQKKFAIIATLGWRNFPWTAEALPFDPPVANGILPFSSKNAGLVYEARAWLRKQVLAVLIDEDLFTKSSASN
jgi:hypothetical protein